MHGFEALYPPELCTSLGCGEGGCLASKPLTWDGMYCGSSLCAGPRRCYHEDHRRLLLELANATTGEGHHHRRRTDACTDSCKTWCDSACAVTPTYTYSLPRTMPTVQCVGQLEWLQYTGSGGYGSCQGVNGIQKHCTTNADCREAAFNTDYPPANCAALGCGQGNCLASKVIEWDAMYCNSFCDKCYDEDARRRRLGEAAAAAEEVPSFNRSAEGAMYLACPDGVE